MNGLIDPRTASAEIDLEAYAENLRALADLAAPALPMAVVKADAYGHGLLRCARAARAAGIPWLGVVTLAEAMTLRADGDVQPVLAWMFGPEEDLGVGIEASVDLGLHHLDQVRRAAASARALGRTARVHLKIDTGLSRNGATAESWPELCEVAAEAQRRGDFEVVGIWSHLIASDDLSLDCTDTQLAAFDEAVAVAAERGIHPELCHLANSAGALQVPATRKDLVRLGIASYGVDPGAGIAAGQGIALKPVMRLRARLVHVKTIEAGMSVSYGATWTATEATTLGLVPLGYADGIPRHASNRGQVEVNGRWCPIRGRVCMDQFVIDLGPDATDRIGDEVTLFGGPGSPRAEDWAEVCDTIGYEIVTRVGVRVPRVERGGRQQ